MHLAVVSLTKTYLTAGRCDISSWFHNFWSFQFLTSSSACRHNSLASKKVIYGYIRYSSEISSLIFFYDINFAYSTSLTVTVHSEQWKSAALSNIFAQSKCHRENQLSHSILSSSSSLANLSTAELRHSADTKDWRTYKCWLRSFLKMWRSLAVKH